jgi:hypothetical protein
MFSAFFSREIFKNHPQILVIMGSLTTCDPGDICATIANCKAANVRCSVISLAAEVSHLWSPILKCMQRCSIKI